MQDFLGFTDFEFGFLCGFFCLILMVILAFILSFIFDFITDLIDMRKEYLELKEKKNEEESEVE